MKIAQIIQILEQYVHVETQPVVENHVEKIHCLYVEMVLVSVDLLGPVELHNVVKVKGIHGISIVCLKIQPMDIQSNVA